ncbi:MAG: enoyl-CoA hydratase-related protein [Chloroflexota bacterium]|nr:enoyl-CoA hydratase-related protein [Chloroflexota bacterium]
MAGELLLSEEKNHILTLSINRPVRRNALNFDILLGLRTILDSLKENRDTRVVILRGVGEKAFCSGMDLDIRLGEESQEKPFRDAVESIINCPCPVIAMIYGYALGAGCDLAAFCDFRMAAESARIGIIPVKFGYVHYYKSLQRFINLIGISNTKELFLTGKLITAERAKEMGLVNWVIPDDKLPISTYSLAQEIAQNAPLAVSGTKFIIEKLISYQKLSPEIETELETIIESSWRTEDAKEGLRAFTEKRKPEFKGK